MFDYVVIVLPDDTQVEDFRRMSLSSDVVLDSKLIPVSEAAWQGAAGNGLGTLFALKNASAAVGKNLVAEVKRDKSVLVVHTAGEGTRNLLTRACLNKSFIKLPRLTLLEAVIKQFQEISIPSRILVTWGDQLIFFEDDVNEIRRCAESTHVLLFGLSVPELTAEIASNYGIQIVRCGEGCELLEFDDSRDYDTVKTKLERLQRAAGDVGVMINMGTFLMSGDAAEKMLEAFREQLDARSGKFNSDELWQLWISSEASAEGWLRERAKWLSEALKGVGGLSLIKSIPLSENAVWVDFGTNESYYNSLMSILTDVGSKLREFLHVAPRTGSLGCEVYNSVFESSSFSGGNVERCVVFDSVAKDANLEDSCMIDSKLSRVQAKRCIIYNVVDHAEIREEGKCVVDVFHPIEGRIRLKIRIGEERGDKEKWWHSRLPENDFSLREVAEMMKGVSQKELEDTRHRIENVASAIAAGDREALLRTLNDVRTSLLLFRMGMRGDALGDTCLEEATAVLRENLQDAAKMPHKVDAFVKDKPWGYELWCVSSRNCVTLPSGLKLRLWELTTLFPEVLGGVAQSCIVSDAQGATVQRYEFPLIVKIIKADENLSVQVHPDAAYAKTLGDAFGKNEAWYVLEASEGAKIYIGIAESLRRGGERAVARKFWDAVRNRNFSLAFLNELKVGVGDVFHIPAGVAHALGGGTKVYEVSTSSGRTFRIYDYDRGRELHLEHASKVLKFDDVGFGQGLKKMPEVLKRHDGVSELLLVKDERFELRHLKLNNSKLKIDTKNVPLLLTCVRGRLTLKCSNGEMLTINVSENETTLVPASVGSFEVVVESNTICEVLCAVPRELRNPT
ncbi:MAG: Mannose-6-phosphate isomerase [Candidatus Alkanophagales archaeon MCA70_species_2]|nr:Mannose-6-phosphate isomerase [Candidatus Alkanophaga liquidiphilum]